MRYFLFMLSLCFGFISQQGFSQTPPDSFAVQPSIGLYDMTGLNPHPGSATEVSGCFDSFRLNFRIDSLAFGSDSIFVRFPDYVDLINVIDTPGINYWVDPDSTYIAFTSTVSGIYSGN